MSGIVGSKFNIRGSGLVGSLGTDGQHMLSAGAGKTNVFETVAAASSDFVKIAVTGSGSDVASVSIPLDRATYTSFDIFWHSIPATDGAYLRGILRNSSGTVTGSNYKTSYIETRGTSTDGLINTAIENSEAEFRMSGVTGNADLEGNALHIIYTPHLTSRWGQSGGTYNGALFTWHGYRIDTSDNWIGLSGNGKYDIVIDDITHLDMYYDSGNVAAHNYTIYGRKA